jgi:PAS domain S-box-containing protein
VSKQRKQSIDWHMQLMELIHSVSLATDFHGAQSNLLEGASNLVASDGISVMWLEGDHLKVLASRGSTGPVPGLNLPASQMGAARAVLDSGRSVVVTDTAEDTRWRPVPGEERVRSWLGVPLPVESRIIGLLEWTDRKAAQFDEEDVEYAEPFAHFVAPPLYRVQLLEETRHRLREFLESRRTKSNEEEDVGLELQPLVREALDFTGAQHAFVFLQAEGNAHLRCVAALGDRQDQLSTTILRGDGSLAGWTISPSRSSDRRSSSPHLGPGPSDREKMALLGIENSLILPLRAAGQPVGMLGVAGPARRRRFDQNVIRLMTHLASQASLIVERTYRKEPERGRYDYEMVLQSAPLGVAVLTVTGDIQVSNPSLAALFSSSEQDLVGRNLSEFLAASDGRRFLYALEEVSITGQRRQVDVRIVLSTGEQRHARMSLALAQISDDVGGNIVMMVEDVSSLKILEGERVEHLRELRDKHDQLQELDQLKSRFVSNVSHELRTPLAVIKLYATLARKGRPEKQAFYLQTIEQETHRLETMVENILDLTRLDRRSLSVHQEPLSAEEIVAQVVEVYKETASKSGIDLRNYVRGNVPTLWADKNHFIQMLTNLLDNALKYTPRGGAVWVAAREVGGDAQGMLEIAVGDGGVGIPEDEQAKIFERFYRGSNNTPGSTGTGLGLAIVRELMNQHGGRVTLESKVGKGSVFALEFPIRPLLAAE